MHRHLGISAMAVLIFSMTFCGGADLKLAGIFGHHAVLQRDVPVPVWGWAAPGASVTVEFAGQKKTARAAEDGKWLVRLDPMPASSESRELQVVGDLKSSVSTLKCADVLDGQSASRRGGERFAAMALGKVYGKPGLAHGPIFSSCRQQGDGMAVKFNSVGKGLVIKAVNLGGYEVGSDKLCGFEVAGEDRRFVRAEARLQGNNSVLVRSPEVPNPIAVRYAWADFPLCNLFNAEGFTAYPFRTDDWPFPIPLHPVTPTAGITMP